MMFPIKINWIARFRAPRFPRLRSLEPTIHVLGTSKVSDKDAL